MKVRLDFVSNSSSSSFVLSGPLGNASLAIQKFSENFFDCNYDYAYEVIEIRIRCKNKYFKEIWEFLKKSGEIYDESECPYEPYYEDYKTHQRMPKDPEDVSWDSMHVTFDGLLKLNSRQDIVSKIDELSFSTQDDNSYSQNAKLATVYKVLDALGCNPDATQSERNFLDDVPASEFEMRMYDVISKAEKANKERDGQK